MKRREIKQEINRQRNEARYDAMLNDPEFIALNQKRLRALRGLRTTIKNGIIGSPTVDSPYIVDGDPMPDKANLTDTGHDSLVHVGERGAPTESIAQEAEEFLKRSEHQTMSVQRHQEIPHSNQ